MSKPSKDTLKNSSDEDTGEWEDLLIDGCVLGDQKIFVYGSSKIHSSKDNSKIHSSEDKSKDNSKTYSSEDNSKTHSSEDKSKDNSKTHSSEDKSEDKPKSDVPRNDKRKEKQGKAEPKIRSDNRREDGLLINVKKTGCCPIRVYRGPNPRVHCNNRSMKGQQRCREHYKQYRALNITPYALRN